MTTDELLTKRIRQIRRELCADDNSAFALRLGKSRQHASALCCGKSHAGKQTLDQLLSSFPSVSRDWLYFGTGPMLATTPTPSASVSDLLADLADTFAHLSHLYSQLSLCASQSAS